MAMALSWSWEQYPGNDRERLAWRVYFLFTQLPLSGLVCLCFDACNTTYLNIGIQGNKDRLLLFAWFLISVLFRFISAVFAWIIHLFTLAGETRELW